MRGLWLLTRRNLAHHRARTAILVACLALSLFVPLGAKVLTERHDHQVRARATATPLVAGRAGNEIDLTLEALYFRPSGLAPIRWGDFERVRDQGMGLVVPLHAAHKVRGRPLIGTTPEYHEQRGLVARAGTLPLRVGDVVLGARLAEDLGVGVGDELYSDPVAIYDISKPASFRLRVCGVLARTGERDDRAAFMDVKTAWVLDGLYHGHDEAAQIAQRKPDLVIGTRGDEDDPDGIVFSGALIEHNVMDATTVGSFHFHGDRLELPLSSVLVWPPSAKDRTILKARVNDWPDVQMVAPFDVVDELMAKVFRIKALLDRLSLLLGLGTGCLIALVLTLSQRLRRRELLTLDRIGCARGTVAQLVAVEVLVIALSSAALAVLGAAAVVSWNPNLVEMF